MLSALNLESNERAVDSSRLLGYEPVEYDERFLNAMIKHAQKPFDQHREATKQGVKTAFENQELFGQPMSDEAIESITEKIAPNVTIAAPRPVEAPPA